MKFQIVGRRSCIQLLRRYSFNHCRTAANIPAGFLEGRRHGFTHVELSTTPRLATLLAVARRKLTVGKHLYVRDSSIEEVYVPSNVPHLTPDFVRNMVVCKSIVGVAPTTVDYMSEIPHFRSSMYLACSTTEMTC